MSNWPGVPMLVSPRPGKNLVRGIWSGIMSKPTTFSNIPLKPVCFVFLACGYNISFILSGGTPASIALINCAVNSSIAFCVAGVLYTGLGGGATL